MNRSHLPLHVDKGQLLLEEALGDNISHIYPLSEDSTGFRSSSTNIAACDAVFCPIRMLSIQAADYPRLELYDRCGWCMVLPL